MPVSGSDCLYSVDNLGKRIHNRENGGRASHSQIRPKKMLEKFLHAYLKWSGKSYLIPFLNGLSHLGRPATVAFPKELMEQGLAIILSGLNNTMAVQSNLDWIWPLWVERQADPAGEEFIPTAINLIKTNLTCRNWTSLGLEDSPREAMVDPVGMLTLHPYGWSVFPYVRWDGRGYFPPRLMPQWQVTQTLLDGALPCVVTAYTVHPALAWKSEAMALRMDGEECIGFAHTLTNQSALHMSLRFGLALRPYNPLTMGHINSIRYNEGLWRVNGKPGFLLADAPQRVVVSDRHHGDPLVRDVLIAGRRQLKSLSGIACGQAEYDLELSPGETRVIESLGFLGRSAARPLPIIPLPNALKSARNHYRPTVVPIGGSKSRAIAQARADRQARLHEYQADGVQVRLPDEKLQTAFTAVKNHLHVFDDVDHFSPGTFLYHTHWFRDSAFIALAFENMGWGARVAPKVKAYTKHQDDAGFFKSQRGEWDSNGQAMWTMVNHVRRGGDPDLLNRFAPAFAKGVRWIVKMRDGMRGGPSPHFGLLPPGFSAEHFGPNDHYYWDNLWSLAGLEAVRWAYTKLGNTKDTLAIDELLMDYRGDVAASMDWAWKKCGRRGLPCSPYRSMDSAAIGNLVGISPLDVLDADEPWVEGTLAYLMENNLRDGMFFQRIVHTGLNPYLSAQLARVLMIRGDARWMEILQALLRRASPTYTWPEALHPRMYGGCMGDGDHGWAAAEFVNLIRDMLVSERLSVLYLGQGVPAQWYRPGLKLEVAGAPSAHGTVDFEIIQGVAAANLTWRLRRANHQDQAPLRFILPKSAGLLPPPESQLVGTAYHIDLHGDAGNLLMPMAEHRPTTHPGNVAFTPGFPDLRLPAVERIRLQT